MRDAVALIVVVASLVGTSPALGQEASDASQTETEPPPWAKSPWSVGLTSYVWFAGFSGDVGVAGLPPAEIDADFGKIFENIDWFPPPVMLAGEVRYDRIGFLTDFIYLGLEGDGVSRGPLPLTAEAELKTMVWTFGGSYRLIQDEAVNLDLLAGARLWMMDMNLTLTGPLAVRQRSRSESWVDPLVGIAGQVKLGGGFALKAQGDVGGFGVGADLDWQVLGTIQYQLNDSITLEAGYRYLAVDFDDGGLNLDIAMHGPIIGGSVRF
jgi:opacity protein-like surface antigen